MGEMKKFILDTHLDLAMNAMEWNRDLRLSLTELNLREFQLEDLPGRGNATVTFGELRRGNIGVCVATLIARYVKKSNPIPGWKSPQQAWAHIQGQWAWYKAMEEEGCLQSISTSQELENHLALWNSAQPEIPIGYILSLEGADAIYSLDKLHELYTQGLRAVGPAHYGPGTYAFGTNSTGGIGEKGKGLLKEMQTLNLILDATHLCDQSFWEALEVFKGPVWASHSNCRALVPDERQFSDDQIRVLLERKAVIGMAFDAWMMIPNWVRGKTQPKTIGLSIETIVGHIDHICQLAGNSLHVMIGSDLDGGFGREQSPYDLESIADLQQLESLLHTKGYSESDIENIFSKNAISFLLTHLP
jgi:membrane dipeptidase